jgi:hypothetical protein
MSVRPKLRLRPLVSKGKPYSTLMLNLLLYGCENWVLTAPLPAPPTAEYIPHPLRVRDGASATHLPLQH